MKRDWILIAENVVVGSITVAILLVYAYLLITR